MILKFKPFTCPNPGQQMTTIINQEGQSCPENMILRELVFNAIDACARALKEDPTLEGKQIIKVQPHHIHTQKLCVVNYGGDYFSKKIAKNHFGTIAHTIQANNFVNHEYDSNKGKGAKISYLPQNLEGLLYYSYDKNQIENVMFQAATDPYTGQYGFKYFECPETEELTSFPYINEEHINYELSILGGTEAICMGKTIEENTWATLNQSCSRTGKETQSGWPVLDELACRFWETPPFPIQVEIQDSNGKNFYNTKGLKHQFQYRSKKWTFELPRSENILKNTKVHVCMVKQKDKGIRFSHEKAFVGFAYKGEVYLDWRRSRQSHYSDLKNCGIYTGVSNFNIIIELDSKNELHSSQDRTTLENIDTREYLLSIKENLPEEIKDILASMQDNTVSSDNVSDFIKKNMKNFLFDFGTNAVGENNAIGSEEDEKGTQGSNEEDKKGTQGIKQEDKKQEDKKQDNGSTRKKRKSSSQRLKDFTTPEFKFVKDGEKAVRFETVGEYAMYVNSEHPIIQTRIDLLLTSYPKFSREEVKKQVLNFTCLNCVYQIFHTQATFPNLPLEEKELQWTPDILSNQWSPGTDKEVKLIFGMKKR